MKKVISLILAVVLLFALSASAFAIDIESIAARRRPYVLEFDTEYGVTGRIVITPYFSRSTLPDDKRSLMEQGYSVLVGAASLTDLVPLTGDNLAVSAVFDVSFIGDESLNPGSVNVTIGADLLDQFVALLHYTGGSWTIVSSARVNADRTAISFTATDLSPFAIIVKNNSDSGDSGRGSSGEPTSPQTSDKAPAVAVAGLGLLASAAACVVLAKKKNYIEK